MIRTDPPLVTLSVHEYARELARDVARELDRLPKTLPSKYFYDARGGALFEAITELPEYYLTRTEHALIERFGARLLTEAAGGRTLSEIVELGSGSAEKISALLRSAAELPARRYAALDVNPHALADAARALGERFPALKVTGYVGDFVSDITRLPPAEDRRLIIFLGSTVGNLDPSARHAFFTDIARILGPGDRLLLGLDLVKERRRLIDAYDDSRGITAEFTRNILHVLNRELAADFPADEFVHVPRWNETELRMEAWLRAPARALEVTVRELEMTVSFAPGEELLTEVSCKFTRPGVEKEFRAAGLVLERWWSDEAETFALALAGPAVPD